MTQRLTIWLGNHSIRVMAAVAIAFLLAACGPGGGGGGNSGY
jgi:hypothetical protein